MPPIPLHEFSWSPIQKWQAVKSNGFGGYEGIPCCSLALQISLKVEFGRLESATNKVDCFGWFVHSCWKRVLGDERDSVPAWCLGGNFLCVVFLFLKNVEMLFGSLQFNWQFYLVFLGWGEPRRLEPSCRRGISLWESRSDLPGTHTPGRMVFASCAFFVSFFWFTYFYFSPATVVTAHPLNLLFLFK